MLLRLTTLGAARVYDGDVEFPDLPAQRLRFALLLFLALERDVSRDEVLAMFWPDRDSARGKHALRQMLYELRQVLGDDWLDMRRDRILADIAVDAIEFEAEVHTGRVERALELYQGPFLQGFSLDNRAFEGWADRRRAHLARLHRRHQREHVTALASAGSIDAALAAARRWVELDPLDDEAAHALIERLAAAGQRAAALQYYENYEKQLAAELDVEPLDETRALIAAIRSGDLASHADPTAASGRAAPVGKPAVPRHSTAAREPRAPAILAAAVAAGSRGAEASTLPRQWLGARWSAAMRSHPRSTIAAVLMPLLLLVAVVARPRPDPSLEEMAPTRIVMQPFADNSDDSSLAPLSNVLTETLAHSLAESRFLDVVSPNGVLLLRARGAPEDSLGGLLGADYLVSGSVSRGDDWVRVDVALIDGRTASVVATDRVERPWDESRVLVDDVVRSAAMFLRRQVGNQVEIRRVRAHTKSEEAWRNVLDAKLIQDAVPDLLMSGQVSAIEPQLLRADSHLAAAARLDRRWAEPVLLRGWVLERRAFVARPPFARDPSSRRGLLLEALAMADSAAERDTRLAGVNELRGSILHQLAVLPSTPADSIADLLARAEAELRQAVELDPQSQSSWRRLSDLLLHNTDRYGEARQAAERAYRLDPFAPEANAIMNVLFASHFEIGDDAQAEGWCLDGRRRFPHEPPFLYCLLALHAWGDDIESDPTVLNRALDAFEAAHAPFQPHMRDRFDAMLAAAYARAGQPDTARVILKRLENADDPGLLWLRAAGHAALLEDAVAVDLLEEFIARGGWNAPRIATTRPFRQLRERDAAQHLVTRLNAPR